MLSWASIRPTKIEYAVGYLALQCVKSRLAVEHRVPDTQPTSTGRNGYNGSAGRGDEKDAGPRRAGRAYSPRRFARVRDRRGNCRPNLSCSLRWALRAGIMVASHLLRRAIK